jgi:hypothetical protein
MASCFALWKDADPDIPIVREAKAGYEKQGGLPMRTAPLYPMLLGHSKRGRYSLLSRAAGATSRHGKTSAIGIGITPRSVTSTARVVFDSPSHFLPFCSRLWITACPPTSFRLRSDGYKDSCLPHSRESPIPLSAEKLSKTPNQTFVHQRLDNKKSLDCGHPYLRVTGTGSVRLDGFQLRSVIFDGVGIEYTGGPIRVGKRLLCELQIRVQHSDWIGGDSHKGRVCQTLS